MGIKVEIEVDAEWGDRSNGSTDDTCEVLFPTSDELQVDMGQGSGRDN